VAWDHRELIGSSTGFDYWNSADATASTNDGMPGPRLPAAARLTSRPNPFTTETTIGLELPQADSPVVLGVYDAAGRRVRTILDRPTASGHFDATWDGRDENGVRLPAGVYYARLKGRGIDVSKPLVLLPE
jgi:flagellar hook assembly protein FlgD